MAFGLNIDLPVIRAMALHGQCYCIAAGDTLGLVLFIRYAPARVAT